MVSVTPGAGSKVSAKPENTVPEPVSEFRGFQKALRDMSPSCFGLVMATGIVSLALWMMSYPRLAAGLFYLNAAQYLVLWVLYGLRVCFHARNFFGDLVDHARAPGYFTLVAASGILSAQFILLENDYGMARWLWLLSLLLWLVLTYTIFMALTIKDNKPPLDRSISGGWLLAVVATQSIAVSSSLLATHEGQTMQMGLNLLALSMWLWGGMLYILIMGLIFYRYSFFPFGVRDLTPPYWINMGAMAISVLAGTQLVHNAGQSSFLLSILPFIKGFTLFYWAAGSWWIPLLLCLGVWRYLLRRYPFSYDPMYWGAIFPLGMYAACTWQLEASMGLGLPDILPRFFLFAACLGWLLIFISMLHANARDVVQR